MEVQQPWHCPSACDERVALPPSVLVAQRKGDRGDRGGVSLNAPLTPQNEIDRFTEVIAPSTIFFGRKYCYRQIGDSISRRRWGSRLWSKGCVCVCPLLSRLRCLLMLYLSCLAFSPPPNPHFLYLNHIFSPCLSFQLLSHFIFYYPITHYHTASVSSQLFWLPFSRVSFHHFLLLTMFAWRGKLHFPIPSSPCFQLISQIAPLLLLCLYNVDIIKRSYWFDEAWKSSFLSVSLVSKGQSLWWNQSCFSGHTGVIVRNIWEIRT